MSFASVACGRAALVLALSVAAWPQPALAEDVAAPLPVSATSAVAGPLRVWVEAHEAFDRDKLRASLAQELKRDVQLSEDAGTAAVRIRLQGSARADVRYTTPGGEELSRSVDLPLDRERSVQVVSWLTVNLVRDEASELLSELRARRKQDADAQAAAQAAAAQAADDKAAADKAAADKAAAEAARTKAEQARLAANAATAPQPIDGNAGLLRDRRRSFDLALATPMSLIRDSPKRELMLQVALWYGDSGGMRGIGVSTAALRIRRDLEGVLVAPAFALVGGQARGVLVSAGYVQVDGLLEGVLVGAGMAVQRGKSARAAVVAAGGAVTGALDGVIVGAGFTSAKALRGVALTAGITLTRGPSEGALLAGGVNFSSDHSGVEVAGGVNIARDLRGIALAPVNVHRRVQGLQLGIVNVAEDVDGAAVGVISYAKNGRIQPVLWGANDGSAHVAVKSIAGFAFTQLGAGINVRNESFTYDAGVGLHLRLTQNWFFEPGLHYSGRSSTRDASGAPDEQRLHVLAQVGYRVGDKVDLLAAAGARRTVAGGSDSDIAPELRAGLGFF